MGYERERWKLGHRRRPMMDAKTTPLWALTALQRARWLAVLAVVPAPISGPLNMLKYHYSPFRAFLNLVCGCGMRSKSSRTGMLCQPLRLCHCTECAWMSDSSYNWVYTITLTIMGVKGGWDVCPIYRKFSAATNIFYLFSS